LVAAGYADFSLIAYHFKKTALMQDDTIPLLYSAAMACEGIAALALGKLFDKLGIKTMIAATFISLFFAPLVFLGSFGWAVTGMIVWGIGMGAQESVLKAAIADLIPTFKRGTGFGLFNTAFGLFWFGGSALMGYLYDTSINALIIFSMGTQLMAIIALIISVLLRSKKISEVAITD